MKNTNETVYRVVRLPAKLRTAMKDAREANEQTNAQFLAQVVAENLPSLVKQLETIGFGRIPGGISSARLPFSEEAGTLVELRRASNQVQLPATQLLQICLAMAVGETPASGKRRGYRKASQAKTSSRKRKTPRKTAKGRKRDTP